MDDLIIEAYVSDDDVFLEFKRGDRCVFKTSMSIEEWFRLSEAIDSEIEEMIDAEIEDKNVESGTVH